MPFTWIPLLESALRDLALDRGVHIVPQSQCMITDGPEIARFEDGSELDTTHYLVNAILCHQFIQWFDEKTFLLPSALPQESLANYSVNLDVTTGIVHIASRFRYVTLKELFLLRKAKSPADSTPFVEFSNGEVLAVPSHAGAGTHEQKHVMQDVLQAQVSTDSSEDQKKCSDQTSDSIAADILFIKARKPFQKKGARLTIDALASMQPILLDPAAQISSPSPGSRIGTDTTPATSATSSNFSSPLDEPKITVPDRESWCKGAVHPLAGNAAHLRLMQVIRSAVQDLPSFHVDTKNISLCCEALNLVPSISNNNLSDPLAFLDLAPSELKEVAHVIEARFALASPDSPDVEIALDKSSGELYLESVPSKCPSQSSFKMIDLDDMFEDDKDLDIPTVHPTVKLPIAAPIHTCMTLEESTALSTLGLRQALSESTIQVLEIVNTYYREIWLARHEEQNGTLEQDQPEYYTAAYEEALQDQAVAKFESENFTLPKETLQLLQRFIVTFLQVWCEGTGGSTSKSNGRWIPGADELVVNDITVKLVEWQQIVDSSKQTQLEQLRPGTLAIQEASSPSDWYLQAIGGDGQYREHRRVEVEDSDGDESGCSEGPVHHINFNGTNIYQRSYTPPEVSFWAAATTYDKVLDQKPSLPPKDKNSRSKTLPAVHVTRVLATQAFKWVDPTEYTGHDIYALWKKKGSAMRNAATSDVNVVYQPVGTWNSDHFTEDDVIPKIAPDDFNYEYATNGNYQSLQLPYHVYDSADEHCMVELNVGKQPKHHFHSYATQIRSPTSLLQYELGAELTKKAALLENRMEKRTSIRRPLKLLEVVTEEASPIDEDKEIGDGANSSTYEEASGEYEDEAVSQAENASDVPTDVEEGYDFNREPVDFVESGGKLEGQNPAIGEDPVFQAEDGSSEAATDIHVAPDLKKEPRFVFQAADVETTVPILEDGRYLSPSKMVPSRMDLVRTPPQSPSKADDHGSWELDEAGNFVSPSKFESGIGSLIEDEDDVEEVLGLIEDQVNPIFRDSANSSDIVQKPTVQVIGKPWDRDDIFGQVAVHKTVDFTPGDGRQASRQQNGVFSYLGAPDADQEIEETYAAIAETRSRRLRSRILTEAWGDGNALDKEEEDSSDGDNEITDDHSTRFERSDRILPPKKGVLSRFSGGRTSLCSEDSKVNLLTRFSALKKTEPVKHSSLHEHPKAAFLARFADKAPARKSNRSLLSLINDGETYIPSTNPGDLALGPDFPNLIVGDCAPADFNDPFIDDVLSIPGLDAEHATASPHHAIVEDVTLAALSSLEDRPRFQETTSHTDPATSEYNAFSSRSRNLVSILSPIHAGDTEDELTPIKARKPIAKNKVQGSSQAVQSFRHFRSVRASSTQPDPINEGFEAFSMERVAQEEKKPSEMTVVCDIETAEHYVSPGSNLVIQTSFTTTIEQQEVSQESGEESSPTISGCQSRDSSEQSSTQSSPSSLDGEDMLMEIQSYSTVMPGKLDIDEKSPMWMPLANCWRHIGVAVHGLPQTDTCLGISPIPTPPQGTTSTMAQDTQRGWKKIGAMQWVELTNLGTVPAAGNTMRVTNPPNRCSPLPLTYGQIAIAVGNAAIEVASWVFWKCMW